MGGNRIIPPSELGLLSVADLKASGEYEEPEDELIDEHKDGMTYSMCECCEKQHSYPGTDYYDLCRTCAVETGYETEDSDWRKDHETAHHA